VTFQSLLPLITLAIGILGTLAVEWIRARDANSRELAARVQIRAQSVEDRRTDFELTTLQEAYKQLNRLGRAATRYHMLDRSVATSAKVEYASRQLGSIPGEAELGEELRLANRDLSAAADLLLDDALRTEVELAVRAVNSVGQTKTSVDAADRAFDAATIELGAAQRQIASRIRDLYTQRA
jgi:hypothetical protein